MRPYYADEAVTLYHGDCLDVLRSLPDSSVDAVVTDPPYGLEFMGREWDSFKASGMTNFAGGGKATPAGSDFAAATGRQRKGYDGMPPTPRYVAGETFQEWCQQWATECLRVLKPGGHLLAFGGSRTWHRLASAVEDAGFEIRDSIAWLYGSGFPKSLDVSKAIDKAAGAEREVVGIRHDAAKLNRPGNGQYHEGWQRPWKDDPEAWDRKAQVTAPATEAAQQWQGWGTALKPAFEPIVVGRKPLTGTVAANVLEHGTGALNIDACRVGTSGGGNVCPGGDACRCLTAGTTFSPTRHPVRREGDFGRWPTNVVLDESQAAELDKQTGVTTSMQRTGTRTGKATGILGEFTGQDDVVMGHTDSGGASRFFPTFRYEAKAPTSERPTYWAHDCDCEHDVPMRPGGSCLTCGTPGVKVAHPTVKPLDLMRWLVRLVTPPGGTVLEPFAGSGTTAEACVIEGFQCIAIEREADYLPLIINRLTKPIQVALDFGEA